MGHKQFTADKREILARFVELGIGVRASARLLGYTPSAVSQELRKGSRDLDGKRGYDYRLSHKRTLSRRKFAKKHGNRHAPTLLEYIRQGLKNYWSPEQISERLKLDFPEDARMRISFKTIYRWLAAGSASHNIHPWKGFSCYLRLKRAGKSFRRNYVDRRGKRDDLPSIEDRPGVVGKRARFGDWECDLIRGFRGQGYLVTVVERSTGLLMASPCRDKSKESVNKAILDLFEGFPPHGLETITLDRGKEFYGFEAWEEKLGVEVYFCHPHVPNERGQNEQVNGLLRQFFPKHKPLKGISREKVKQAVVLINNRPKKKLGYRTTREYLADLGLHEVLSFA